MKKVYILITLLGLLLISCTGEFDGSVKPNVKPTVRFSPSPMVTDSSDINSTIEVSRKEIKVPWYANDADDYDLTFRYIVTTDSSITLEDGEDAILNNEYLNGNWKQTKNMYANVSFPYSNYNGNEENFVESFVTYTDTVSSTPDTTIVQEINKRTVYSTMFLYAVDSKGARSNIVSKKFGRTNIKPEKVKLSSDKLGVKLISQNQLDTLVGIVDPYMILKAPTETWSPFDFKWYSKDDDGEVTLEYKWNLSMKDNDGVFETVDSSDWSSVGQKKSFSKILFDKARSSGQDIQEFMFSVKVRDDAFVEADSTTKIRFKTFLPKMTKGALLLSATFYSEQKPNKKRVMIPEEEDHLNFYKSLLEENGFVNEDEAGDDVDPVDQYGVHVMDTEGVANLQTLSEYRLVIIASDDWVVGDMSLIGDNEAADWRNLREYLSVGGKILSIGTDVINPSGGDISNKVYVDDDISTIVSSNPFLSSYIGMYKIFNAHGYQRMVDEVGFDDYDCIGAKTYAHAPEYVSMRFDSVKTNSAFNYDQGSKLYRFRDNGLVMANIQPFIINSGTPIFSLYSIYDLEDMGNNIYKDETGYEFSVTLPNDPEDPNKLVGHTTGTIGTTYIKEGDAYRTALLSFPLYYMNNDETTVNGETYKPVSKNFKALIDFFDVSIDPFEEEEGE